MSLVAVLDLLIVALLATLVVLEVLRPRRVGRMLEEVDRRTAEATAAIDAAQQRLERTVEKLSAGAAEEGQGDPPAGEPPGAADEPPSGSVSPRRSGGGQDRSRQPEEAPEGPLSEKIARHLEESGGARTERERRLLGQLQRTLEMPQGRDRYEQERLLYQALQAATQEDDTPAAEDRPDEERELIAKLRGQSPSGPGAGGSAGG
jgi:type II secretory pathway pseudopilin PulG